MSELDNLLSKRNAGSIMETVSDLQRKYDENVQRTAELEKRVAMMYSDVQQLKQQLTVMIAMRGNGPTSR